MFNKKIFFVIILALVLLGLVYSGSIHLLSTDEVRGAGILPTAPFGGQILSVIPCTCSYGHVVVLGPPIPGLYHFTPFTTLYSFFQTYRIGAWLLGNYFPGTGNQCLVYVGVGCVPVPNLGAMQMVGTSL